MAKKKIEELVDRYYDLLNEIGVLEDRVKDFERRHAKFVDQTTKDIDHLSERIEKSECAHSYEGSELKKLNEKITVLNNRTMVDYTSINAAPKDEITFEDCYKILEWCNEHGLTKEERVVLKRIFNKYVFCNSPFELFPIKEDDNG